MASAKSKKGAVSKKVVKKSAPKKVGKAIATKKAKPVASKKVTKPVAAKKKTAVKKSAATTSKKAVKKLPVKKQVKTTVSSKATPAKKVVAKKGTAKPSSAKSPAKAPVKSPQGNTGKIAKKPASHKANSVAVTKPISPKGDKSVKEIKAPVALKSDKKDTSKEALLKKMKADKNAPDPLQAKAEKVIKELEETMDLSKLRPRISTGTTAPKPLPKPPSQPIKLPEPTNTTKEKYQVEFEFRSSPKILFTSLSDSSGLAGWFADEVHTKDDVYTFVWEGGESVAKLVALRDLHLVRFQWLDDTDGTYFQFEIKEDDITSDIALLITDFANPGERETSIRLWESQVQKLRMLLGSL
ncbi:MAG: hypothetical protein IPJ86_13675 [Bacteroidetes bacterium]|nr:hypothetical protein [Bacteroidota bacterium]